MILGHEIIGRVTQLGTSVNCSMKVTGLALHGFIKLVDTVLSVDKVPRISVPTPCGQVKMLMEGMLNISWLQPSMFIIFLVSLLILKLHP